MGALAQAVTRIDLVTDRGDEAARKLLTMAAEPGFPARELAEMKARLVRPGGDALLPEYVKARRAVMVGPCKRCGRAKTELRRDDVCRRCEP